MSNIRKQMSENKALVKGNEKKAEIVQSPFSQLTLTEEQKDIIKNQIAPGISDADLMYCLEVANQAGLNPLIKEIFFVPRKAQINGRWIEKYEPMVGRKGARAIARRKGMKVPPQTGYEIKEVPVMINGQWQYQKDLVGWAELTINGEKVRKEAPYSVFVQRKKDGNPTQFWQKMPTVMVEKTAEFQLLDAVYGLDGVIFKDAAVLDDDTEAIVVDAEHQQEDNFEEKLEQIEEDAQALPKSEAKEDPTISLQPEVEVVVEPVKTEQTPPQPEVEVVVEKTKKTPDVSTPKLVTIGDLYEKLEPLGLDVEIKPNNQGESFMGIKDPKGREKDLVALGFKKTSNGTFVMNVTSLMPNQDPNSLF